MKFEIKWSYPGRGNTPAYFPQTYSLGIRGNSSYVRAPSFCAGVYIVNLIGACTIGSEKREREYHEALSVWRELIGDNVNGQGHDTLSEAMAFSAFCIFNNIKTTLKDVGDFLTKRNRAEWSSCSRELLGEEAIHRLENSDGYNGERISRIIQSRIDGYAEPYNRMIMSYLYDEGKSVYDSLKGCLELYNDGNHELIGEYLSPMNKKGRCFATFIKRDGGEKFVSFSGLVDAKDGKILRWLGKSKPEKFVAVAEQICKSLNAEFVPLNLKTRKYFINNCNLHDIRQCASVEDKINSRAASEIACEYSCCERKIFGRFDDGTPDGTLYVKFKICAECALGLAYQMRSGHNIILCDGLEI